MFRLYILETDNVKKMYQLTVSTPRIDGCRLCDPVEDFITTYSLEPVFIGCIRFKEMIVPVYQSCQIHPVSPYKKCLKLPDQAERLSMPLDKY